MTGVRRIFASALIALLAAPCAAEPFRFTSDDTPEAIVLVGDYRPPKGNGPVLVLLHGLGSSRNEWASLVERAQKRGWGTLAYDGRGHNDSRRMVSGGTVDHQNPQYGKNGMFWQGMVTDFRRAAEALAKQKKIGAERIVPVGASIGANVSLIAAAADPKVRAAVLLSPGLNYAGLQTEPAVAAYKGRLLMVAARPDGYAFASVRKLELAANAGADAFMLDAPGPKGAHGTQLFDGKLEERILDWVGKVFKKN